MSANNTEPKIHKFGQKWLSNSNDSSDSEDEKNVKTSFIKIKKLAPPPPKKTKKQMKKKMEENKFSIDYVSFVFSQDLLTTKENNREPTHEIHRKFIDYIANETDL
jgi:hypothetical protein